MFFYKIRISLLLLVCLFILNCAESQTSIPRMYFTDTTSVGMIAKDPVVVSFGGRYLMYYSIKTATGGKDGMQGWGIGVAESNDLYQWKKIGTIPPAAAYEEKGLCAPGALIRDGKVHLFYQTYGNGPKDAICHAVSSDGLHFDRNPTNPIFRPTGSWNNGRAIDAEVYFYRNRYFLYVATRDPSGTVQKQAVAAAPANTDFSRDSWKQGLDAPILEPELPWEGQCIEAASLIKRNGKLYMFYAGSYNNKPQQIGVATSKDGIHWKRLWNEPFLVNGKPGAWNSSESGHPGVFEDKNGDTYLFYQGNNNNGKSWYLSNVKLGWNKKGPYLVR